MLKPLYQVLVGEVLASLVVGTDATRIDIRDAHRALRYTGFFWIYRGDDRHPFSAFDFTPNQARAGPDAFLKNYRGFLQCDASGVYDGFFVGPRMTEVGCWAHARRKYHEARDLDARIGQTALAYIGQLYQVERELRQRRTTQWHSLDLEEIAQRIADERQNRSQPALREFRAWLDVEWPQLLPKNPLRQAMEYTLRHWDAQPRLRDPAPPTCPTGRLPSRGKDEAGSKVLGSYAPGQLVWPVRKFESYERNWSDELILTPGIDVSVAEAAEWQTKPVDGSYK